MPAREPVAAVEAVRTVVVAGNGRGELGLAWSTGSTLGFARFSESIWQDFPWNADSPQSFGAVDLDLGVMNATQRLVLARGEVVGSYRPRDGEDWPTQTFADLLFFIPAFGGEAAWAVYQEERGGPVLARYDFERDVWEFVAELPAPPHTRRNQPALAVANNGAVVVAYLGDEEGERTLQVARFEPQGGEWGEAVRFLEEDGGPTGAVEPVLCAGGRVLLWLRLDSDGASLFGARDVGGGSWTPPVLLQRRVESLTSLRCVTDDGGRVLAVWVSIDAESRRTLWSGWFDGVTWTEPEPLAQPDATDLAVAEQVDLAGQLDGEAVVIYHRAGQSDNQIWSRRFRPGVGWGRPRQVTDCCAPGRVAMDGRGMAAVVWLNRQGVVWWSRLEEVTGEFPQ